MLTLASFDRYQTESGVYRAVPAELAAAFLKVTKGTAYKLCYRGIRRGGPAKGTISYLKMDAIYFDAHIRHYEERRKEVTNARRTLREVEALAKALRRQLGME